VKEGLVLFILTRLMLFFAGMGGVGDRGADRTNFRAAGRLKEPYAFNAFLGVDFVRCLSLADGLYRAFRFTGSAADALV
jgi:hypothetical protein